MIRLLLLLITSLALWSGSETISCITLTPASVTLKTGEWVQASATAYDELGNVIPDASIQWLPTPDMEHCVSVSSEGVITGVLPGSCGVGALSFTIAGKVITHKTPINVVVAAPTPEPSPTPKPCSRLSNGKCNKKKGCVCL